MRHLKNSKVKSLAPHHTAAKGQKWTPEPNSLVLSASTGSQTTYLLSRGQTEACMGV